jgi:hypothetical protein
VVISEQQGRRIIVGVPVCNPTLGFALLKDKRARAQTQLDGNTTFLHVWNEESR